MTEEEWKLLLATEDLKIERELMAKTRLEDEHPEWYDGPCDCSLCMSYAD